MWKCEYGALSSILDRSGVGFNSNNDYKIECNGEQLAQNVKVVLYLLLYFMSFFNTTHNCIPVLYLRPTATPKVCATSRGHTMRIGSPYSGRIEATGCGQRT